jgi:hypothetical protein
MNIEKTLPQFLQGSSTLISLMLPPLGNPPYNVLSERKKGVTAWNWRDTAHGEGSQRFGAKQAGCGTQAEASLKNRGGLALRRWKEVPSHALHF